MKTRTIDVRTEMLRLVDSKPVHAAAGMGVLASETLRELPTRIAKLRAEAPVASLPARATTYVQAVRARAVDGYDKLAVRGEKAISGKNGQQPRSSLNGSKKK